MIYFLLFFEFFKIGLFSFGGGMATIPFLYKIADKYQWFDKSLIVDMIAIAESTPGPIGINMATYVGYHTAGIVGSLISTFSLVIPSFILVIIVSKVLDKFKEHRYFKEITASLQPIIIGLIIAVFLDIVHTGIFFKNSQGVNCIDIKFIFVFIFLLLLINRKNVNIIIYFILSAIIGLFIKFINF